MQLQTLLTAIAVEELHGNAEIAIRDLCFDSRKVAAGSLFFALPGSQVDGHDFIPQAEAHGAAAIVVEHLPASLASGVCYLRVANVRAAMARLAASFYGQPSCGLLVIGVTGTNGKTTTTYLLEEILRQAGYAPAVFGTVEYRFGTQVLESPHTTPESVELMRMMAAFKAAGANAFILEVSSHALEQHRVDGVEFDVAVFTNLTPEHLDYHQNLDNYFASKRRLFSELLQQGAGVVNLDNSYGQELLQENSRWVSFGLAPEANVQAVKVISARDGIHGEFITPTGSIRVDSALIGDFNISNLLAAAAAARAAGISCSAIEAGIRQAPQVPGRLQRITNPKDVLALVDYAHTGDALEQVLKTLAKLEHRRLLCLVGCGGDRDPSKRPVMAEVAVRYADLAVFTSDNPRTEDPLQILAQIRQGALAAGAREFQPDQLPQEPQGFVVIPDRREAIVFASQLAMAGDLLLVAGKGHEDYQILGKEKIHFDDREELCRALNLTTDATDARGAADD